MTDFPTAPTIRTCAISGRELKPGDKVYGVLMEEGGKFVRRDYAADAWPGPPTDAVAFWSGRIPAATGPRKPTFNDEHLSGLFVQLATATDPARVNLRYTVALLLMRRKRLKFEDAKTANGHEVLVLRDARTGTRYEVPDPRLTADEIAAVQEQVFAALGWE